VETAAVDLGRRDHPDGDRERAGHHAGEDLLALVGRELLRVVQPGKRANAVIAKPVVVEQDAGDDERSRQAPAPGLVDSRDEAEPELAVELE
jgi:hypothetical protein